MTGLSNCCWIILFNCHLQHHSLQQKPGGKWLNFVFKNSTVLTSVALLDQPSIVLGGGLKMGGGLRETRMLRTLGCLCSSYMYSLGFCWWWLSIPGTWHLRSPGQNLHRRWGILWWFEWKWSPEAQRSGTIRCGLVEETSSLGGGLWGFGISSQAHCHSLFLVPLGSFSSTRSACMLPCFPPRLMEWTSKIISPPQWNISFIRVTLVMGSLHSNETLTESPGYITVNLVMSDRMKVSHFFM